MSEEDQILPIKYIWRDVPVPGEPNYATREKVLQFFNGDKWVDVPVSDDG